jgi:uncharacterized protein
MKSALAAFVAGVVFALGLVVAQMTQPSKVLGFLDVFGAWDASLMLVMLSAVGTHAVTRRMVQKRRTPLFAGAFTIFTKDTIDWRLLTGAVVFGVGWGLSGFCPGPALVNVVGGGFPVLVFVGAMSAGMLGHQLLSSRRVTRED